MIDKTQQQIARGNAAKARLEDPAFKDAVAALRAAYIEAWATSSDASVREGLWRRYTQIQEVCDHLITVMNNGKLARAQIEQLNRAA